MARVEKSYADIVDGWKDLRGGFAANAADLPYLELHIQQLAGFITQAEDLSAQQAVLTGTKQQVTKQIEEVLDLGQKLATFLRVGVRQHYGNRSEKLVEFGLQPFRGKKCVFRAKAASDSNAKATTDSDGRRPPIPA